MIRFLFSKILVVDEKVRFKIKLKLITKNVLLVPLSISLSLLTCFYF